MLQQKRLRDLFLFSELKSKWITQVNCYHTIRRRSRFKNHIYSLIYDQTIISHFNTNIFLRIQFTKWQF